MTRLELMKAVKTILEKKGNELALDLIFGEQSIENWLQIELAKDLHQLNVRSVSVESNNHDMLIVCQTKEQSKTVGIELKTQVDKGRFIKDVTKLRNSITNKSIQEGFFIFLWLPNEVEKSFDHEILKREFIKCFSPTEKEQLKEYAIIKKQERALGIFCIEIN